MSKLEAVQPARQGGILRKLASLAKDRRGVAAVEFAFIAPLMMSMYFATMEITQGIETNKKVGRVGSTVADLITQQQSVTTNDVDAIMRIAGAVLQPYRRSAPKIVVTAIQVSNDATMATTVAWSRKMENGVFSADAPIGTTTTLPATLKTQGAFLIKVDSYLSYQPVITWTASQKTSLGLFGTFDNIAMKETFYLRPRMSAAIACTTC